VACSFRERSHFSAPFLDVIGDTDFLGINDNTVHFRCAELTNRSVLLDSLAPELS
jgi:hypothetical protein